MKKIGRNDPCPCGSGKKYKKCGLRKDEEKEFRELNPTSESDTEEIPGNETFEEGTFEEGERIIEEYRKINGMDGKIDFVRNLIRQEKDLPTDFMIDIFSSIHDSLGSEGRHLEAAQLFALCV